MAVAADYINVVQALYIAYFGRPADTRGATNFANQLAALNAPTDATALREAYKTNAGIKTLVDSFGNSGESKTLYGENVDTYAFVTAVYNNVLNRGPQFSGLTFWADAIDSGKITRAEASLAIMEGALSNTTAQGKLDAQLVNNKIAVAKNFTASIDTAEELTGYSGKDAAAIARGLLTNVKADTVPAEYQAAVDASLSTIVNAKAPTTTNGLTVGIDTFPGTTANDTFNALNINATTGLGANTLNQFDTITGGAGTDTLNIYSGGGFNVSLNGATVNGVEIINIINQEDDAAELFGTSAKAGDVDASKFVGATQVWQAGTVAADVVGLGNTTTAGFRGTTGQDINVTATAATASVALEQVAGDAVTNVITLNVDGNNLAAVNVAGTIVKNDADGDAATVLLAATAGKDVTTFTVNTGVATTVEIDDGGSTKKVNTLNAAASVGALTFVGDGDVVTINSGSGADTLTLDATLNGTIKAATLNAGAGNDTITVDATAISGTGNTVNVNAGAGNDTIDLTISANAVYTVLGGAGNDKISIAAGTVKTTDVIDGGEGTDTIELAGAAAYVADDYIVFNKVLKNFEAVSFTTAAGGTTAVDASQLAGYKSFTFEAGGQITKVAADQILNTAGNLTATGNGYSASDKLGTVTVTANVTDDATLTVNAAALKASVTAASGGAAGDVAAALAGNFATATVALANGVNTDDSFSVATLNVTGGTGGLLVTTGLTITGNGIADIDQAANSKIVTIDASGLASKDAAGAATTGLILSSAATAAETIKLGAGLDTVSLTASTYGAMDTVTGLNLVVSGGALTATSDQLNVGAAAAFEKFTTTQTDFDLAVRDAAASTNQNVVFSFGGDTYVFIDTVNAAGNVLDAGDTLVKLTGAVNLDNLVIALNTAIV